MLKRLTEWMNAGQIGELNSFCAGEDARDEDEEDDEDEENDLSIAERVRFRKVSRFARALSVLGASSARSSAMRVHA